MSNLSINSSVPADVSAQLYAQNASASNGVRVDYPFVGGILRPMRDPDPQAGQNEIAAQNGQTTHTQFTDRDGQTIHVVRTPAPYYIDKNGDQQPLEYGEQAPADARWAYYDAYQETMVVELQGEELGLLQGMSGPNDPKLQALLAQVERNNEAGISEATGGRFQTLEQAREYSRQEGYYGSGAHRAAANAASARVGGLIPAEWFMQQDPFMGRAGSNHEFFPNRDNGMYPGTTSKIGVAHDADYGLGANFNAGPLRDLYGLEGKQGYEGLDGGVVTESLPNTISIITGGETRNYEQYGTGHRDWFVENVRGTQTRVSEQPNIPFTPIPNPLR